MYTVVLPFKQALNGLTMKKNCTQLVQLKRTKKTET